MCEVKHNTDNILHINITEVTGNGVYGLKCIYSEAALLVDITLGFRQVISFFIAHPLELCSLWIYMYWTTNCLSTDLHLCFGWTPHGHLYLLKITMIAHQILEIAFLFMLSLVVWWSHRFKVKSPRLFVPTQIFSILMFCSLSVCSLYVWWLSGFTLGALVTTVQSH